MDPQAERLKQKMAAGEAGASAPAKVRTFDDWMAEMAGPLKEALPSMFPVERFSRMIITNYKATPGLRDCTMQSVLGSALQAAQLGLMIGSLDQAYLVPFSNYKGKENGVAKYEKEAQLVIGYKGYMELGFRTGKVSHIDVGMVYVGDNFDYEYGSNEFIRHKPMGLEEDDAKPTHYYVIVHLSNGNKKFLVRTFNQILRHARKHTDMYKTENGKTVLNMKSNWNKNHGAMALKTVIRELFKTMQLTTDVMLAMAVDETIKNADRGSLSKNMAEDIIDVTNWDAPAEPEPAAQPTAEPQPQHTGGVDPGPDPGGF